MKQEVEEDVAASSAALTEGDRKASITDEDRKASSSRPEPDNEDEATAKGRDKPPPPPPPHDEPSPPVSTAAAAAGLPPTATGSTSTSAAAASTDASKTTQKVVPMPRRDSGTSSGGGTGGGGGGRPPALLSLEELNRTAASVRSSGLSAEEVQREMGIIYSRRKRVRQKMRQESLEEKKQGLLQENVRLKSDNATLEAALRKAFSDVAAFERRFASAHASYGGGGPGGGPPGWAGGVGPGGGPAGGGDPHRMPHNMGPHPPPHGMGYMPPPMYYGGPSPMGFYGPPHPHSPAGPMYPHHPPHPHPHMMQHPHPGGPHHPHGAMHPYGGPPLAHAQAPPPGLPRVVGGSPVRRLPPSSGAPPPAGTGDAPAPAASPSPKRQQGWDPDRLLQHFKDVTPATGGSDADEPKPRQHEIVAGVPASVLRGLVREWKRTAPEAAHNLEIYLQQRRKVPSKQQQPQQQE